ncbi:MAG: hypothetical protein LBR43_00375 [Spiroplasmataceae bacterium]|jgi:hypothetical protein|nr:hypothetical protein [Spiroplasmataceae bacterium]
MFKAEFTYGRHKEAEGGENVYFWWKTEIEIVNFSEIETSEKKDLCNCYRKTQKKGLIISMKVKKSSHRINKSTKHFCFECAKNWINFIETTYVGREKPDNFELIKKKIYDELKLNSQIEVQVI